jgi:2,3-dihydroxyphenylpropionate 1,2-dioxygenase
MSADTPSINVVCLSHSPQMGADTAHLQGLAFRTGFATVKQAVHRYDPTLVVFFGPDHMRALAGIAPCFTVTESACGYGDWGTPDEPYAVPKDQAIALGRYLAADGIDIAVAPQLRLDHGFSQSTNDLFDSLSAVPLIPIVINCVDRPLATLTRTAELGKSVGRFLRSEIDPAERVLVMGSGGISHAPPSLIPGARDLDEATRTALITDNIGRAAEAINPDWDVAFLATLASEQWASAGTLTEAQLEPAGTGGAEVRTWVAALFTGGARLETVVYEPIPEWITGMGISASPALIHT